VETRSKTYPESRLLFTAPWEPVIVRRGDALGLRALADQVADALAPDLSNRVRDGRWVTILAWCLARSHEAFHASGGRCSVTREDQSSRYAWLRPLELMWVARTISLADDWQERSLAGQRRVRPWYEDTDQTLNRFGMSEDQFRAYRQTGMYGGYRVVFRKWPEMTVQGDGWTPGKATIELAKWLDAKLGKAKPAWLLHASDRDEVGFPKPNKRSLGKEHEWWLRQWNSFDKRGRNADENTLPRRRDDSRVLPEGNLLKPRIFGNDPKGLLRLRVTREVAKASARTHIEVCRHLASAFGSDPNFLLLPHLSRLADAGMAAMDFIAQSLQNRSQIEISSLAALPKATPICEELIAAAHAWHTNAQMQLRHIETAHRFAAAIRTQQPRRCLEALLHHHEVHGGGLRWFVLRKDKVEPRSPWRAGSSRYRFRLWPLCRLGAQCGVLHDMPTALNEDVEVDENETTEIGCE
jgi:hypothetical protein